MLITVPLDASCRIVEGAPVHVTAGIATYAAATERDAGTDYSAKNFGGAECAVVQKRDTFDKWLNITGQACLVDWSFMSATDGNPTVVDGTGNVVGYAKLARRTGGVCSATTKPKVATLIARRTATDDGGCSLPAEDTGATAIVGHFFPVSADWLWDIPNFDDARAMVPFTATGYANPWDENAGPLNLWPATYDPDAIPLHALWAPAYVDPTALPAVDCDGTIAHPAPATRTAPSA